MPIFMAPRPYTRTQKWCRWTAASLVFAVGLGFAIWAAIDCAHIAFGYVASYSFELVFIISVICVFVGLLVSIYWRTRFIGVAILGAGLSMYLVFLASIGILKKLDKVAWVHEAPLHHFGPDQPASLVIYYRPGTTDQQIEDFVEHKLEGYPSSVHDGTDFPEFVSEYSRLIPSQANGFNGSSLAFRQGSKGAAVDSFVAMVTSDPRVARVFADISPSAIHLDREERALVRPKGQGHAK